MKELKEIDEKYKALAYFNSNENNTGWSENILLAGNTEIAEPISDHYSFGFIPYDYKNEIEDLHSVNTDFLDSGSKIKWYQADEVKEFRRNNLADENFSSPSVPINKICCRTEKDEYISNVEKIKKHIQAGDIYEMNYCIEFYVENVQIDPLSVYRKLNLLTHSPYSCLLKSDSRYIISSSPECFLKKRRNFLSSHPIKGTARREGDLLKDNLMKKRLLNDPKERGENIMITDLVRNDLSKIAQKSSVKVEELCELHTFQTVHQLISSVICDLKPGISFDRIIRSTFPMGSMTGAPKIRAMQIIDEIENFARGLYSGSCGYFSPNGDFDLNVVIRSILYNSEKKYLSIPVGSAITAMSDPGKEYDECLLKAGAMIKALTEG